MQSTTWRLLAVPAMLLAAIGLAPGVAAGAIYYIDAAAGDDNGSGASTSTPWKTLGKVKSRSFSAGDQILLKRGGVWNETLVIPSSGAAGAPIVVGAYGTGNNPLLDGQNVRWPAVDISGKSYVTVNNLSMQNASNYTVWVHGSSNVTIKGCALKNSFSHGIGVDGISPGVVIDGNTYSMDSTFVMHGTFIFVSSPVDGVTISNNTAVFNLRGNNSGVITGDVNNALIFNNTITNATQGIGIKGYNRSVTGAQVHDNAVYNTDATYGDGEAIEFTGIYQKATTVSGSIYRNFVKGGANMQSGISAVYATNSAVYSNIVLGPAKGAGYHWTSYCTNVVFYNNVADNVPYGFLFDTGSTGVLKNNIITRAPWNAIGAGSTASVTEDYNIFYLSGANKGVKSGPHSLTTDPLFLSATPVTAGDVRLKKDSPAIDSGADLSAPYNTALDPAGTMIPFKVVNLNAAASGWTRGAYAYVLSTPPPPLTVGTVAPDSGSGSSQVFTASYSNTAGFAGLSTLNLLINSSLRGANACWVRYYRPNNGFYLQNDAGAATLGPVKPSAAATVRNSQCVLNASGSTAVATGNTITIQVSLTFTPAFAGPKTIYAYAADVAGLSSGWQNRGTWTAP